MSESVKVEVAVLGSPSLTVLMVPVDVIVKQHLKKKMRDSSELGGGSCVKVGCGGKAVAAGLPVPNSAYGSCGCNRL